MMMFSTFCRLPAARTGEEPMTIAQTITSAPSAALRIQERLAMTSPLSQMEQTAAVYAGAGSSGKRFLVPLRMVAAPRGGAGALRAGAVDIGGAGFHDPKCGQSESSVFCGDSFSWCRGVSPRSEFVISR